jgi:hypothetical protein
LLNKLPERTTNIRNHRQFIVSVKPELLKNINLHLENLFPSKFGTILSLPFRLAIAKKRFRSIFLQILIMSFILKISNFQYQLNYFIIDSFRKVQE